MDNINMKNNKYITVLDFEVSRIFQYKVEKRDEREVNYYEDFLIEKGHNMNNIEWMAHDIKEFVDHTIRKLQ